MMTRITAMAQSIWSISFTGRLRGHRCPRKGGRSHLRLCRPDLFCRLHELVVLLLGFFLRDAVALLKLSAQYIPPAPGRHDVVIGQQRPVLLDSSGQLSPFAFQWWLVHVVTLLDEFAYCVHRGWTPFQEHAARHSALATPAPRSEKRFFNPLNS